LKRLFQEEKELMRRKNVEPIYTKEQFGSLSQFENSYKEVFIAMVF
jgi:hypothetical protein